MDIPADLKYTAEHEWLKDEGGRMRVGITAFAQDQLGDVVYVELPRPGEHLTAMKPFGVVESVKAASDLFSPITGVVVEVNGRLVDEPDLVNRDPYGEGWLLVVEPVAAAAVDDLLNATDYRKLTESS